MIFGIFLLFVYLSTLPECSLALAMGPAGGLLVLTEEAIGATMAGVGAPCIAAEVATLGVATTEIVTTAVTAATVIEGGAAGAGALLVGGSVAEATAATLVTGTVSATVGGSTGSVAGAFIGGLATTPLGWTCLIVGGVIVVGAAETVTVSSYGIEILPEPVPHFWDRPWENVICSLLLLLGACQQGRRVGMLIKKKQIRGKYRSNAINVVK